MRETDEQYSDEDKVTIQNLAKSLWEMARRASAIAITTHIESDGDGMVAAFALQHLLQLDGLKATIVTDGEDLSLYSFLQQEPQVQSYKAGDSADLVIVLDCNSYDRLGQRAELVSTARQVAVIDHHVIEHNPIRADLEYIDTKYASVGALLYDAFESKLHDLSAEEQSHFAECVYVTLLNDTNNYTNANTDARVFALSAKLVEHGARPYQLYMAYMQNNSAGEMRYIGGTLATIELHHQDEILFMHSDLALKESCKVDPALFRKATRYVQGVRGLKALVYFREDEPGLWKLSLRSLNLNVQEIASRYGGGGHRQASGCTMQGTLSEIKQKILGDLTKAMNPQ
jgi:bifunctional oligoribonuclease and PAP phosphatase NrnA